MNVLGTILENLRSGGDRPALLEVRRDSIVPFASSTLWDQVRRIRGWLRNAGIQPGDRVGLLAPNCATWAAADLAIVAEGAVCVPLYARQNPVELVAMLEDCAPSALIVADTSLEDAIRGAGWNQGSLGRFDQVLAADPLDEPTRTLAPDSVITLVYTSGTSGEPKGVMITAGNMDYMIPAVVHDLDRLMAQSGCEDHPFHYLPFCFAGSRIMLWTQLHRGNALALSTDLNELKAEMAAANPSYSLNVPALLERVRSGVVDGIRAKGGFAQSLFETGERAFRRQVAGEASAWDRVVLGTARRIVFRPIRDRIGTRLGFLVCGSAPLSEETQRFFEMLSIPVYQVYGLTETTAIVTMDRPDEIAPGRVGAAIPGCETKLSEEGELLVRGPNVFKGYWNRPEATIEALADGWLHTGDQAELDEAGRWKIIGRMKNLLVPESGHNVAPEPLEQQVIEACEGVAQAMLIGHGKPFLSVIVTGEAAPDLIESGLQTVNADLPHYRRIRNYIQAVEPFSDENGQLTANQKMRRRKIEADFQDRIEELYAA